MCFNYSLIKEREIIEKQFNAIYGELSAPLLPMYNASAFLKPFMPVICNDNHRIIQCLQWGLIPFWVKDSQFADKISRTTVNARAETIHEKPSFKHAVKYRRCLVLADGFYEWHDYKGKKYPYYIYLKKRQVFCFAGIWDLWTDPHTGVDYKTFSIITTEANSLLAAIHNKKKRMPVILKPGHEKNWLLDDITIDAINDVLVPYPATEMNAHTVSKDITGRSADPNTPNVVKEYIYPELPPIQQYKSSPTINDLFPEE